MSTSWQQWLEQKALQTTETFPADSTAIAPLELWGIIRVKGPDAEKFLQGQLSCNLREVSDLGSRLGSHCNIKGHVASLYRVFHVADDEFWLRCHRSIVKTALALLNKYIIFSKATAEVDETLVGIGVQGPVTPLADILKVELPQQADEAISTPAGVITRLPDQRLECWLYADQANAVVPALLEQAVPASVNAWLLADIRAGLPDLRAETREHFIPQMTNMQVFDGISFNKGCYTGQEIITRLQHRGVLKKAMFRARLDEGVLPAAGTAVNGDKDSIGEVVFSAYNDAGKIELLAVINKNTADSGTQLTLGDGSARALTLLELPYTLDPDLFERPERPAL